MQRVLITAVGGPAGISAARLSRFHRDKLFVVGTDIDPLSAGAFFCDRFVLNEPVYPNPAQYLKRLRKIVQSEKIDLILPTGTEELVYLSLNDVGVPVIISPPETVETCGDKQLTYEYFATKLPEIVPNWASFPNFDKVIKKSIDNFVFIKPRVGRGGRGGRRVSLSELKQIKDLPEYRDYLCLEWLPGREWTVDVYVGKQGEIHYLVPRERIALTGGISLKGRTVKHRKVISIAKKIIANLDFYGPICIQLKMAADGSIKLVEINPRLSGGIEITALAGADPICYLGANSQLPEATWKELTVIRYLESKVDKS